MPKDDTSAPMTYGDGFSEPFLYGTTKSRGTSANLAGVIGFCSK